MDNYQENALVSITISAGMSERITMVYPVPIPSQHSVMDLIDALQRSLLMMQPKPKLDTIDNGVD